MEISLFAELYLTLGAAGFIIVTFISLFIYMVKKMLSQLEKIYDILYSESSNRLTLQSASDVIESQYKVSKFTLVEAIMRVYYENNIHDTKRQQIIRENLLTVAKNLHDKDCAVLYRLYYKQLPLGEYIHKKANYEKIVEDLHRKLISNYSTKDIMNTLTNEFATLINEHRKYLEKNA